MLKWISPLRSDLITSSNVSRNYSFKSKTAPLWFANNHKPLTDSTMSYAKYFFKYPQKNDEDLTSKSVLKM